MASHSLRAGHIRKRPRMGAFLCVGDLEGSNSRVRAETRQRRDRRGEAEAHLSGRATQESAFDMGAFLYVSKIKGSNSRFRAEPLSL